MSAKAKESAQIQKARKKLKQQLAAAEKRINTEALQEMSKIIQAQITRHNPERISLKKKVVTLFDENTHPAKTESKFVMRLLHQLKSRLSKEKRAKALAGRITVET
jgi:hypothetical protein